MTIPDGPMSEEYAEQSMLNEWSNYAENMNQKNFKGVEMPKPPP